MTQCQSWDWGESKRTVLFTGTASCWRHANDKGKT